VLKIIKLFCVILLPLGRWMLLLLLKAFLSRLIRLLRNRRKSIIKNLCCSASLATLIREKCFFFIFCFSRSQFNVFLVLFSLPLLHLKEFSLFLGWELKVLLVLAAWVRVGFLCFIFRISFFFFLGHDKGLRGSGKSAINFTMLGAECRFRSMISPRGSDNCRLSIVDLYLCAFDNAFLNSGSRSLCCLLMNFPLFHRSRFPLDCCRGVAPDWVPKRGGGS